MINKVKSIICETLENDTTIADIENNCDIINDLGINSLQMIDLILQIEDEFDIEIDFATFSFEHLSSLEKFVDFIKNQSAA